MITIDRSKLQPAEADYVGYTSLLDQEAGAWLECSGPTDQMEVNGQFFSLFNTLVGFNAESVALPLNRYAQDIMAASYGFILHDSTETAGMVTVEWYGSIAELDAAWDALTAKIGALDVNADGFYTADEIATAQERFNTMVAAIEQVSFLSHTEATAAALAVFVENGGDADKHADTLTGIDNEFEADNWRFIGQIMRGE